MIEKKVRSLLLKSLGAESYLTLVSGAYIRLIKAGFMKSKYPELFFLSTLIKPGFVCIDIGANVGYYSVFLSRFAGVEGYVHAVEPVPMFARILKKNLLRFGRKNVVIHNVALGSEEKIITLGTPVIDGVFRHGLTKIVSREEAKNLQTYDAEMKIADKLFSNLHKIDFVKCDVEGFEVVLLPQMLGTIRRFTPLIQIEINEEENRKQIIALLEPIGYKPYKLVSEMLVEMTFDEAIKYEKGDFYFRK